MNANPIALYTRNQSSLREVDRAVEQPAVINNKLEALKVLVNSILIELTSMTQSAAITSHTSMDLTGEVQEFESGLIRCALTRTGGRQRRAAALLGIKPTTLHEKMKRYGMIEQNADIKIERAGG